MSVESWLKFSSCDSQAMKAREFGARVYCIGVMDFDHSQVGVGLHFLPLPYSTGKREHSQGLDTVADIVSCLNTFYLSF